MANFSNQTVKEWMSQRGIEFVCEVDADPVDNCMQVRDVGDHTTLVSFRQSDSALVIKFVQSIGCPCSFEAIDEEMSEAIEI